MAEKLLHLQGMRGVAIFSVILFHYFPSRFPNGYLGVDLFFVLSGYLMSMMLNRQNGLSSLSILNFFYRRLKRILPFYYLIVLFTTVSLIFLPFSNITPNLTSAWNALLLSTNLIQNGDMNYFDKLGLTKDMFTHTWSLCLEMQFYLLFPFIWMIQVRLPDFARLYFLYAISACSIAYHILSDEFTSFNSVGSRIWQFLLGNVVFLLANHEEVDHPSGYTPVGAKTAEIDEKDDFLTNDVQPSFKVKAEWVTTSFALVLLVFTAISTEHLTQDYARLTTTIISSIMILFGHNFFFLECKTMIFLGEISYSWYLVHWPMVSAQKLLEFTSNRDMAFGVLISFMVAVSFHYSFEKKYLLWEKTCVIVVVGSLMLCTVGGILELHKYVENSSELGYLNFKSMTKEEVKNYNTMSDNNDQLQLRMEKCTYIPEKNIWIGYCEYQNFNKKRNNSIFIIGNSWAANQASIVFQECHRNAGNLAAQVFPSCEVLFQTKKCGCGDLFTNDVQRVSPDQLFIIARAVQFEEKRDMPAMIEAVAAASKKLALLSTFVKDKIFILNVFPCFSQKVASKLNEAIDKGTTPNYTDLLKNEEGTLAARLAMKDVVRNCPKCVLYDYVPSFEFNGTVLPYDPVNFVSYMTKGQHFTTAGLESIRHVYKEICTKI